jgi:1-acyl-sn-glycerol-3-phosphate acyltransferase
MSATRQPAPAASPEHRDDRDRLDNFHKTRLYRIIYGVARHAVRLGFRSLMRMTVRGVEHVPRRGPLVVASNHLHNFDPFVVGCVTPRSLYYMAKKELFASRAIGAIIGFLGVFPIDRGAADRGALRFAVHLVEDGEALFMFPEGTRSPTARIERVLPGAAFVAVRTGAPVLPVAITGTQALPFDKKSEAAGRRKRGRADVTVTIGEPFHLTPGPNGKRPSMEAASDEIMRHVAALLPPEYRGIYAESTDTPLHVDGA